MKKFAALLLAVMMMASCAFAMTAGTYEGKAQGMMGELVVYQKTGLYIIGTAL